LDRPIHAPPNAGEPRSISPPHHFRTAYTAPAIAAAMWAQKFPGSGIGQGNHGLKVTAAAVKNALIGAYGAPAEADGVMTFTLVQPLPQPDRTLLIKIADGLLLAAPNLAVLKKLEEFEKANVTYTLTSTDNTAVTEEAYDLTPVKLYEVITTEKIGGEWKKVLCVVAYDTRVVLSCQEYPYPAHWYIEMRIDDEDDTLWPNNSLAQRVQGLNMAFSDGNSAMFIGSLATAFPMLAVNGSITGNKYKKWTPAMILELPHGVEAKVLGTSFNPGALPLALQKIEEMADAVVGISRLGTGQALPADTREAAINGILQAQSEAKESYADACSSAVKKYFQLLDTYLIAHFDELKQVYGTKIPIDDLSELPEEYKLEVTGQNSGASPQVLMQKLQMLMGMSAQPASVFSPRKVEERIGQAMELPFDVSGLRKDEIDQLLQTIALLDQQGFPGAELAMQGLMVMAQNAINATQGGVGVEQPGGAGDTGGTPQEATGAEGQL
jgi:hypothetical protein